MISLSPQRQRNITSSQRRYDDMNCIMEGSSEAGSIYLGNIDAASNIELLQSHRIGAMLSLCPDPIPQNVKSKLLFHSFHYVEDHDQFNISSLFDITYDFIEKSRKTTNILIHCYAGISRSATVLIAYLMKKLEMGVREAMDLVQRKRWQIYPNNGNQSKNIFSKGFLKQLSNFEKKLFFKPASTPFETFQLNRSSSNSKSESIRDWKMSFFEKKPSVHSSNLNSSFSLPRPDYQEIINKFTRNETERKSYQSRLNTNELMRSFETNKSSLLQPSMSSTVSSSTKINGFLRKVTKPDEYFRVNSNKISVQKEKDDFESKFNRLKVVPEHHYEFQLLDPELLFEGPKLINNQFRFRQLSAKQQNITLLDLSRTQRGTYHHHKPMSYLHY